MAAFVDHGGAPVWRVEWNLTGSVLASSGDDGRLSVRKQAAGPAAVWTAVREHGGASAGGGAGGGAAWEASASVESAVLRPDGAVAAAPAGGAAPSRSLLGAMRSNHGATAAGGR